MSNTAARFRRGKRAERNGLHGTTVVLSLVLHLVGFGAAVGLPRLMPRRPPGDAVYVVDLVSLPPGAASPAPAAPKPAPARRQAAPKPQAAPPKPAKPIKVPERTTPKEPAAKKPEPKKPDPKPAESKPAEPKPVAQQPIEQKPVQSEPESGDQASAEAGMPADASSPAGGATATGEVGISVGGGAAGKGASDEYTFYLSLLDRNIRRAWSQPIYTGADLKTAMVSLELSRSGRMLNLELLTPSGYDPLDRSVIRAVRDAAPFPPFPHFLGLDTLVVQIVFELDPGTIGAVQSGE